MSQETDSNEDEEPQNLDNIKLFDVSFKTFVRDFKGQTSGPQISDINVQVNTVDEFRGVIYEQVRPLLCREVVFSNDNCTWGNSEITEEDLDK